MSLKYQLITGTKDVLAPEIFMWQHMEAAARKLFHTFCFQEIRTPAIEYTELFVRSVGSETDIVEKEMYTFVDRDEKSVSLRPEETAGVVRAYLENGLYSSQSLNKLYYIGPMFRRERPQQGRYRQFHQIGAESIGSYLPGTDAESIIWIIEYFNELKVKDVELHLNSSGCQKCKPGYTLALQEKLDPKLKSMCPDCQRRYKRNIFRLLDCKQDACRAIIKDLPAITDYLCVECSSHFSELKKLLDSEGVTYNLDPYLVRGIDYYTKTVFEFIHKGLGSQNTVAAGGRYDMLVQDMGGIPTGAVGFSIGEERLAMILEKTQNINIPKSQIRVYLISLDKESYDKNLKLLYQLRRLGIAAEIDYEEKSLKAQMRTANKLGVNYAILRGSNEIKEGIVTLKDMQKSAEEKISDDAIASYIQKKLKEGAE
jgi:histidyl-tRNA synthetase